MSQLKKQNNQPANNPPLVSTQQWQGPLPPPSVLSEFNNIIENGAERIMRMAELEQENRHSAEHKTIDNDASNIERGQWLGAATAIASIIAAVASVHEGADWKVSCALVGLPMLGVIRAIVNRK